MRHLYLFTFYAALLYVLPVNALSCDCSNKIGNCQARVSLQGDTLDFRTNTNQCAQVTYDVNGEPGSITITYGQGSTNYYGTDPEIQYAPSVRSCEVCESSDSNQQSQQRPQVQPRPQPPQPTVERYANGDTSRGYPASLVAQYCQ